MNARSSLGTLVLAASLAAGCGGKKGSSDQAPAKRPVAAKDFPNGLDLRLSNGKTARPDYDRTTIAAATKLAPPEVAALLARAKPLEAEPADLQAFAIRPGSQPPPRAGQVISASFPPPASTLAPPKPADAGKGLEVLRWMPEGAVPLAPEVSVTFSQPMIAVTSQDDAAKVQPVKLTPTPNGRWRWIGTRTILFDPEVRFPQATTYTVEIPAGTRSASGAVLAAAKSFTFETPAPTRGLELAAGGTAAARRPDVRAVRPEDRSAGGARAARGQGERYGASDPAARRGRARAVPRAEGPDRRGARRAPGREAGSRSAPAPSFRPTPRSRSLIREGTPSAEGPNTTKAPQSFSFRTFPPLHLVTAECGWGGNQGCRPRTPIRLEMNNQLDADKFDPAQVKVTPAIADQRVALYGNQITIGGTKQPRTTYTAVLSGKVVDEFGQRLGDDSKQTFVVGDPEPTFHGPGPMVVLDPAARARTLDFFTTSYKQLKVQLYKVTPADYPSYLTYLQQRWRQDAPGTPPGTKVLDKEVAIGPSQDLLVETHVDLVPRSTRTGSGTRSRWSSRRRGRGRPTRRSS